MRGFAMAAGLSLFSAAAFAQDVKTDYDKSANFGAIKTFAVKLGTSWGNPISEKRVIAEIQQSLVEKGWQPAEADKADALVVLHGATSKQKTLNTFYSGMGGYGGYCWAGWGAGAAWGAPPPPSRSTRSAPWSWTSSTRSPSSSCSGARPRTSSRTSPRRTRRSWPRPRTRCSRTSRRDPRTRTRTRTSEAEPRA